MRLSHPIFLISLLALLSLVSAAKPTSFCKCTCGSNSTIVPLDARQKARRSVAIPLLAPEDGVIGGAFLQSRDVLRARAEDEDEGDGEKEEDYNEEDDKKDDKEGKKDIGDEVKKPFTAKTCNDCNRQFCIDAGLPMCKEVPEKDIFTMCFQRDSAKDQAVVYIFIIATVGLLGWALLRPYIGNVLQKAKERRSYIPVPGNGESE